MHVFLLENWSVAVKILVYTRSTMFLVMGCIYYIPMCKSNKVYVNEDTAEECKYYTWITNWNQQSSLNGYNFIHVNKSMIKWRKTYEIIYECSRTRSNFIFIYFFYLMRWKFLTSCPEGPGLKIRILGPPYPKACRTMYYVHRIRIDPWTMVQWIWPAFSVQTYDPSIFQSL